MTDLLIEEAQALVPSIANMTNAYGVPELGLLYALFAAALAAIEDELTTRNVTAHDAKAAIDAETHARMLAKFGGR